ncbi:MAG TPA: hypothetical protein VI386_23025 [Candidatus Sulfotelmatobacter sp.]
MNSLFKLASVEGAILLGSFCCIVLWKLLTGSIDLSYLLDGDVRDTNSPDGSGISTSPSPGRAQTLVVTLAVAFWYLLQVIHNPKEFPKLSWLTAGTLAGSHALYLGGKARALIFGEPQE